MAEEKFFMTYKYNPDDLFFICKKVSRLDVNNLGQTSEVQRYEVIGELTPGHEGDTRYRGITFRIDDPNCTVEPYTDKYKIDVDQINYLKRLGL